MKELLFLVIYLLIGVIVWLLAKYVGKLPVLFLKTVLGFPIFLLSWAVVVLENQNAKDNE